MVPIAKVHRISHAATVVVDFAIADSSAIAVPTVAAEVKSYQRNYHSAELPGIPTRSNPRTV